MSYGFLMVLFFLFFFASVSDAFSSKRSSLVTPLSLRLNHKRFIVCSTASRDDVGKKLYDAATKGDVDKLKLLITETKGDKDTLNWRAKERYGRTPLVIASYYGKFDAVKLLMSTKGVDVNLGTDFGATALHFAAHRGHFDVVKLLLADRRTKVNVLATGGKWTGKTALDVCGGMGMSGKPEVIEAIKKKGGKPGK